MEPMVIALSVALGLSLVGVVVLASLYWGERTAHHAAKELAEAEQNRFKAYQELVEDERRKLAVQKTMDIVQPLWDQVSS